VPLGQHPPFATVTEDDHTAWILVAETTGIAFTCMALLTRIEIRSSINRGWSWDDTSIVIATVGSTHSFQRSSMLTVLATGPRLGAIYARTLSKCKWTGKINRVHISISTIPHREGWCAANPWYISSLYLRPTLAILRKHATLRLRA